MTFSGEKGRADAASDDLYNHHCIKKKESRLSCSARPTERNQKFSSPQESEEISRFCLRKLDILLKRSECRHKAGEDSERRRECAYVGEDIMRKDRSFIPDRFGREIGYFQSAFEQIKFENSRFRC